MNINLWNAGLSKCLLFFSSAQQVHAGEKHSVHAGFLLVNEKKNAIESTGLSREKG